MSRLITALQIAAGIQLAIGVANVLLPRKLHYRENLARVSPIVRQIFVVHSAYVAGVVLLFAAVTLRYPAALASGAGLGRFLACAIAVFWGCRIPVQVFYYDRRLRREHPLADLAMIAGMSFLAVVYGAAALTGVF